MELWDADNLPLQCDAKSGWKEISRGLALVVRGYCVLIAGGLLALLFITLALGGGPAGLRMSINQENRDLLLLVGLLLVGLTALFSYGLVLLGQWRCLMYAPERQGAKELMYVCLNLVVIASLMNVAGTVLDGGRTYAALRGGEQLDLRSAGTILQLGSALVGLLASLIFSGFLRTVASCFNDHSQVRSVDFNLAFLGLLLGGSCGMFLYVQRLASKSEMLPWLAAGWLFCFAWHLWLVNRVRQSVRNALEEDPKLPVAVSAAAVRKDPEQQVAPTGPAEPGRVHMHTLSGLRRMARGNAEAANEAPEPVVPAQVHLHRLSGFLAKLAAQNEAPDPTCSSPE